VKPEAEPGIGAKLDSEGETAMIVCKFLEKLSGAMISLLGLGSDCQNSLLSILEQEGPGANGPEKFDFWLQTFGFIKP
jgi:hypothetical protein